MLIKVPIQPITWRYIFLHAQLQNLKQGRLVNGSLGKVIAFTSLERPDDLPERSDHTPSDLIWPVVQFTNGMKMIISPVDFTVNNANGEVEARRSQVAPIAGA